MDAVAEGERRGAIAHVPLATIAERQAGKVRGKVAGSPCVAIAVARDVVDPALRNDLLHLGATQRSTGATITLLAVPSASILVGACRISRPVLWTRSTARVGNITQL